MHIPFCRSRCSYCGFVSSTGEIDERAYIDALCREIDERVRGDADTVFIGGGTPSVLSRGSLARVFSALRKNVSFAADTEITTEANPDSCTDDFLRECTDCGVNRLSLGVQSLNDDVLRAVGRRHTAQQALDAIERAQKHEIRNISCDLMLGLPLQTEKDVCFAVDELCARGIMHLSVYALTVEEGTPLGASGYAPDEDKAADWYDAACARLLRHGFSRYEVSNFCRKGYACRHNIKYWTGIPYTGVGAAAHSYDGVSRSFNTSDIAAYTSGRRGETVQTLTAEERLEEYIMLGLRTYTGISFARLDELCGGDWRSQKKEILRSLTDAGFLEQTESGVRLCEKAYYTMNEIIVRLL